MQVFHAATAAPLIGSVRTRAAVMMKNFLEWNRSANERALKSVRSWRLWVGFPIAVILAFPFYWGGDLESWFIAMLAYGLFLVQVPERRLLRSFVIIGLLIAAVAFVELDETKADRSNSALHPNAYRVG